MPTILQIWEGFAAVEAGAKAATPPCCRWQASQTFLPASIGFPPAAWRFARKMAVTGVALGLLNSFCSGTALCLYIRSALLYALELLTSNMHVFVQIVLVTALLMIQVSS